MPTPSRPLRVLTPLRFSGPILALLLTSRPTAAQTSTASTPASEPAVIELSPFTVNAEQETGWTATRSLAGSRLNTDLKDIAAPIEVLTKDFMDDFALNSISDAAIYTTNVEGVGDNIELGSGQGFGTGYPPPTRIRGLNNGTLSRDFFAVNIPSDNYNLDRVTIAAGPNNLLFGTGNPAGVIDTSLKRATFHDANTLSAQFDSNSSQRYSLDVNRVIVPRKLAVRFDWLHEEKEYAYKPSGSDQTRLYGAVQWRPFSTTSISVNYEDATVHNIRPQLTLPFDNLTPWLNAGKPAYANGTTFVPSSITNTVYQRETNSPVIMLGDVAGYSPGAAYNVNNTVGIIPAAKAPGVSTLNQEADGWTLLNGDVIPLGTDVGGLAKLQRVHSKVGDVFINQQIGEHLFIEAAAQQERYESWNAGMMSYVSAYTIQADPNRNLADGVTPNPNFGKLYVEGAANGPYRTQDIFKTQDERISASYEWNFTHAGNSWWRKLLGSQRLAGLYSRNDTDDREQDLFARILPSGGLGGADPTIAGITLRTPYTATGAPNNGWANDATRSPQFRYYLSSSDLTPRPNFDLFAPITLTDSNGRPYTIDMMNTGLTDKFGRRLGAGRENVMDKHYLLTQQIAYQGFFWDNRIVATLGFRRDRTNRATVQNGYGADTFTGLLPLIQDIRFNPYDASTVQSGDTKTRGVVARPLHGLVHLPLNADISVSYNESDTFQPNVSNYDPYGNAYPGAKGTGRDKSVRLDLWDGKFGLKYTEYTDQAGPSRAGNVPYNRFRVVLNTVIARMNTLAYGNAAAVIDPSEPNMFPALGPSDPYWVTSYQKATGKEITLDWNVTSHLQVLFTMNREKVVESNIGTDWWAWLAKYVPEYQKLKFPEGGVLNPRDLNGNGVIDTWDWNTAWISDSNTQTVAANYDASVIQGSTGKNIIQALDGKSNEFVRSDRYNINAIYRFTEGRLKGLSVGGAFRHRAAPLLAYGATIINGIPSFDLSHPYYGKADNLYDLSINYRARTKFWRFTGYRIGLNVRNVFDTNGLYAKLVDINGNPERVGKVSEPRTAILSVDLNF